MSTSPATTRRTLVLSTAVGIVTGSVWGAALQALATPSKPTISIVGKRDMQLVLLDTTRLRALILLGTPDLDLQLRIPALLTMFHQRIDLLAGTQEAIAALDPDFRSRWRVAHIFVLPSSHAGGQDSPGRTWVDQDLTIDLDGDMALDLTVSTRNDWNPKKVGRRLWLATVRSASASASIAPDQLSAEVLGSGGQSLFVVPVATTDRILTLLAPASVAINARDDLASPQAEGRPGHLVRIYPEDIARFEFREDGIGLPAWAER